MYTRKQFRVVCSEYLERLQYAIHLCDMQRSYAGSGEFEPEVSGKGTDSDFMSAASKAIINQAMLTTANFYIFGQSNEFTLYKLMKIIGSDSYIRRGIRGSLLDEVAVSFNDYVKEHSEVLERLIEWRNRYIGHNDKKYFTNGKLKEIHITVGEMTELLSFGVKILRNIASIMEYEIT